VALVGTFRTPSLRELKLTAPYGHNGSVATLEEAIDHYIRITSSHEAGAPIGTLDPALPRIEMTPEEKKELIEFLLSLSSDYDSVWTREPVGLDE
jgi:cytochrome c peroxidase